jgi:hypothetical protein
MQVLSKQNRLLRQDSGLAERGEFYHIAAARYCGSVREAAALPGRFLPELGRFRPPEAAFFLFSTASR